MGKINYKKKDFAENLSKKKGFSVLLAKKLIDDVIEVLINNISKKKWILKILELSKFWIKMRGLDEIQKLKKNI